jgi:hypothetical protein
LPANIYNSIQLLTTKQMKLSKQHIGIIIVGLALATGHAIRGQFGHEQGAAWAGAMGGLALVLVSGRADWYKKMLLVALSMAVGWGAGGMISYGQIAGSYSQSDNFINVFYGHSMLFIIGGLYGLLGGGLVGLTLDSTKEKKVKWGTLLAEMGVGGLIVHMLLVEEIGFRMTPPRGDAWAICLGAGLAMLWYMARNNHLSPLRVAFYSTIGGGFGFAFGTFFHLVMNWVEIPFNTWNMAEYAIGLFGGIGMAYGVFTSKWPKESAAPSKWENITSMLLVVVFVPVIIFRESFSYGKFIDKFHSSVNTETIAFANTFVAGAVILIMIVYVWIKFAKAGYKLGRREGLMLLVFYSVVYTILSYISTGTFAGMFHSNHHLYFVNIGVIVWLLSKNIPAFFEGLSEKIETKKWIILVVVIVIAISIMAVLAIEVHGPTPERYDRFPSSHL